MRVNCSLCSIWNRPNVFYQVFTSKKHTPPVVCTQCCAWRDAHSVCFSWGLKGNKFQWLPGLVLSRSQERAPDISKSCALWLQKPSTPHIFLWARQLTQRAATQERIFTSQSPFSLQIHSLITLYPVQNGRLKDATQNLPVLGQPYKHNSYKSYTSRMSFQENSKCCQ